MVRLFAKTPAEFEVKFQNEVRNLSSFNSYRQKVDFVSRSFDYSLKI